MRSTPTRPVPAPVLPARAALLLATALLPSVLGGCLAKAAYNVATLPVRAASGAVDLATTSQSEADEKRGREIRRREERLGGLDRDYRRQRERCEDGNQDACRRAEALYAEIQRLSPSVPLER
jgi:hypothetical protein